MAHSNGKITAPVDQIGDVKTVLGVTGTSSNDLAWLCQRDNKINIWAKFRPTGGGGKFNRDEGSPDFQTRYNFQFPALSLSDISDGIVGRWTATPSLTYHRLSDFNGYNHNAKCEFENQYYKYFEKQKYGSQEGIFYNGDEVWALYIMNDSSTPTNDIITLREIFNGHPMKDRLKLAFVIKTPSKICLLSTGINFKDILNTTNATTQTINVSNTETAILQYGGSPWTLSIRLNLYNLNTLGGNNLFSDNMEVRTRFVLLDDNTTPYFISNLASAKGIYSLQAYGEASTYIFGMKTITLKYLNSYVNVKDVRNAGAFYGTTNGVVEYEYKQERRNSDGVLIWDWIRKQEYTDHPPRIFKGQNVLTSLGRYNINFTNNTETQSNDGAYVKYRLSMGGCICCEFMAQYPFTPAYDDPSTDYTANYYIAPTVNSISKGAKLYFDFGNEAFGAFVLKIGNDAYSQYVILGSNNSNQKRWYFIGNDYDYATAYKWTNPRIATTLEYTTYEDPQSTPSGTKNFVQFKYCTKNATWYSKNNTIYPESYETVSDGSQYYPFGHFNKISSNMIDLGQVKYYRTQTDYDNRHTAPFPTSYLAETSAGYVYLYALYTIHDSNNKIQIPVKYEGVSSTILIDTLVGTM